MEEFSTDSIQKQLKERRLVFMEKFKSMVWDLHPKIMNLFRQNPILIELEETLDSVKEYFVGFNGTVYSINLFRRCKERVQRRSRGNRDFE